jgi:predicted regulator of Ras-like GTPase activity (Roadblock/LC7/MglB family)
MPLTGTLRDLSLPNLIQVQCNEQNQSRVTITRGRQQGTLIFAGGELVYAHVGNLTGEQALYEMLTWEDGDFRVDDQVAAVERNITAPWTALLVEGLHRADEARAERNGFLQSHLRTLVEKPGIRGALVIRPNGAVRAEAKSENISIEPSALVQVYATVEQIQQLLNTGTLQNVVLSHPNEKIWLQKLHDDYFICALESRTSLDVLVAALKEMA